MAVNATFGSNPFYPFSLESIVVTIKGSGNKARTFLPNLSQIGMALRRRPLYIAKYFGLKLGVKTFVDDIKENYSLHGVHAEEKLKGLLVDFIKEYVICTTCNSSTTQRVVGKKVINLCEKSHSTQIDEKMLLSSYVLKNPPQNLRESSVLYVRNMTQKAWKSMKESMMSTSAEMKRLTLTRIDFEMPNGGVIWLTTGVTDMKGELLVGFKTAAFNKSEFQIDSRHASIFQAILQESVANSTEVKTDRCIALIEGVSVVFDIQSGVHTIFASFDRWMKDGEERAVRMLERIGVKSGDVMSECDHNGLTMSDATPSLRMASHNLQTNMEKITTGNIIVRLHSIPDLEDSTRFLEKYFHDTASMSDDLVRKSDDLEKAVTQIAGMKKYVAELEQALAEEKARAAEVVVLPAAVEPVEEVVELKKSAYLNAVPPAADHSAELEALKKENARLQEKNESLRSDKHQLCEQMTALEKRVVVVANGTAAASGAASTSTASGAAGETEKKAGGGNKKGKKGAAAAAKEATPPPPSAAAVEKKDEEERVRAERRLVVSHIGKLIGGPTPALDDSADTKSYESWLQSVVASIKDAQEKAKKSISQKKEAAPAPAPVATAVADNDEEKDQLRAENEGYREALDNLLAELHTIEQLKSEAEKANGKA